MEKVTPWKVSGNVDYEKVLNQFGVSTISTKLKSKIFSICKQKNIEPHHLIKRNIAIGHRDLEIFIDAWEKGKPVFLYTGRSPSAGVHLGHYVVWEFTCWLQKIFDCDLWFQFPDEEKYLFKEDYTLDMSKKALNENLKDVASIGFISKKTFFLINTKDANLLYPRAIKVSKKLTSSAVKSTFGLTDSNNIGSFFYTSMQSVPTFLPSDLKGESMHCLIPHAIDQDPHFRLTRDVVKRLGYNKPASVQTAFLPGLKGFSENGKMSSSDNSSSIFLDDSANSIKKKINKYAFSGGQDSLELHKKLGGNPDIDIACQWLKFLSPDDDLIDNVWKDYASGKVLSGEVKKIAIEHVQSLVKDHQDKKESVDVEKYLIHKKKLEDRGYKY